MASTQPAFGGIFRQLIELGVIEINTEPLDERSHAQLILHELGEYLGYLPPPLLERLIEDAPKIYKQRPIL